MNLSKKTLDLIEKYPDIIEKKLQKWIDREVNSKKPIKQRQEEFRVACRQYVDKYGFSMCKSFYEYWSQRNTNGRKMLWEMQKVFELPKRLAMWHSKEKQPFQSGPQMQTMTIKPGTNNQEILDEIEQTIKERKTGRA